MENNIFWRRAMTHEKICTKKEIRTGAEEKERCISPYLLQRPKN